MAYGYDGAARQFPAGSLAYVILRLFLSCLQAFNSLAKE